MAWTAPITHAPLDVVSSADWNTYIANNANYLLSGRQYFFNSYSKGSAITLTGAGFASFADVDATNVAIVNFTPSSTRVWVRFTISVHFVTTTAWLDIFCTTLSARGGATNTGLVNVTDSTDKVIIVECPFSGLTPGTPTTFKLQAKLFNTANSLVIESNDAASGGGIMPVWLRAQEF